MNRYFRKSGDLWARILLLLVMLISISDILGWIFDLPVLKNVYSDWTPMRPVTAVLLFIASVALFYDLNKPSSYKSSIFLVLSGSLSITVSFLTLLIFTGLLDNESIGRISLLNFFLTQETKMALETAVVFLFLGSIMLLFSTFKLHFADIGHILTIPSILISYFIPVSYLFGLVEYFKVDQIFPALNTGVALCALSVCLLLIRKETWLMKILIGDNQGGMMVRRILPGILILPLIIGGLRIYGEQKGYFSSEVGVILVAITYTGCLFILTWWSAWSVNVVDEKRKISEKAKELNEIRFATTLSSIGDAVIATDERGYITYLNPVAEKLTGWFLEEALDQPSSVILNIVNETSHQEVESPIAKVIETGNKIELANHTVLIRKDNTEVFIDDSAAPIRDENGRLTGVVLVFRDIGERKKSDKALRESEARLQRSQEIGHLGGWELDLVKNELTWSDEIYRIFGLRPQEFGATYEAFLEAVHPDDRIIVDQAYSGSVLEGRNEYEIDHRIVKKENGEIRYVHEKCTHIRDNSGRIIKSVGMVHDITDRKLAEIALKESEEKIRRKLQAIISPEGNLVELELEDIINGPEIQSMMEHLYQLTSVPMAIIDKKGKVLVGVGWQEICTKFHRVHPETCKHCLESDIQLTEGIPEGEYKLYKCANGMWDIATPIIIGGQHKGNLFMGQFFFQDEKIDYDFFKANAAQYGFDEQEYLFALDNVLRMKKEKLEYAKGFFLGLASKISDLSYSNIKLARTITEHERVSEELLRKNERLDIISETSSRLLASNSPQKLINDLCQRVMKYLDCQAFFNFIVDEEKKCLHLNACAGIPDKTVGSIEWLDYGVAVCGCVARDGERIIAEDIPNTPDPRTDLIRSFGIKAYCCHPLMAQGKVLGTLSFGTRTRVTFSEDEISLMKTVTELVAIAMSRIRNEKALFESEKRAKQRAEELEMIMNLVPSAIWISHDPDCRQIIGNKTANEFYEAAEGENVSAGFEFTLPQRKFFRNGKELAPEELTMQVAASTGKEVTNSELDVLLPSGKWMTILGNACPLKDDNGSVRGCIGAFIDISERKIAEREQEIRIDFLRLVNECTNLKDFIHSSTIFLQQQTGCEAIGIRLKQDEDYPYFETLGFPEKFVRAEKFLCARDHEGGIIHDQQTGPVYECLCGNILCRKVDHPNTLFTEYGSFWTNRTSDFDVAEIESTLHCHIRNRCNREGYESVALIPLVLGDERIGLLQLNDKKTGVFTPDKISMLESLAIHFSVALARFIAEEDILKKEQETRKLNRVLNALGKSSQVMMHSSDEVKYVNEVCRILVEDCGHSMVWVGYARDDRKKSVEPVAWYGFEDGYIENLNISWADNDRGKGPTGTAIRTRKIAICRNMLEDEAFAPWREAALKRGYNSSIVFPLMAGGEAFGAISIYSREPDPFSENEIELLKSLSEDMAYGITTIRLKESENKALYLLKESEERYRTLFNEMVEGFAYHEIILNEDGNPCDYRFLSANPAFEKHTGLNVNEIIGKKATEVIPSLEIYWLTIYGEVAMTGKSVEFENYSGYLDRFYRVSAFSDRKGYFATIIEDITERTLAEKELNNTKNYLESLINYANAPIIVWNSSFEIQLFNKALEHLTGYHGHEVLGKKLEMLFPENSIEESTTKIKNSLTENLESIEIPVLTKGNEIRTVLWNSAGIYDNENNNLISIIAQGNDITERKKAEHKLNEATEKLNLALDNGNIGIWEKDVRTNNLTWDKRMEKMFGFEEGTFDGNHSTFEKCLLKEDISYTREAIRKALEEDIPYETLYRIKTKNNDVNYINAKALVIKDENGVPVKMSGVCFDVTEMKKGAERVLIKLNEELHRSNKELEQFAYIASHDLQEPLRMVSSFTQLLAQRYSDKLDNDAKEFINYAVDGASRMQRLINDLLNYSRIGTRGQKFVNIDFNEIYRKTISNLSIGIQEKQAVVTSEKLPVIQGDEIQMIQLLQNLIGNALKFCETVPKIHVSAKENDNSYIFSVKDNGIGIEEQYYNKIFLIFQRLVPKDQYSGTGIGLAICKRIIERHGGKIWIESQPGQGTTFYFSLLKKSVTSLN